jgi:molecular chaperone DnaK (HSP70)
MNLYNKQYYIKSTNGKECDIELIITKILEKVSQHALSKIQDSHDKSIRKEDIKWVVSIPAIWEEKSKQIMINASKKAGLIIENRDDLSLFLALEPEVAGIYYNSPKSSLNDQYINSGNPYIICDIGAGTVDICTHRKVINNMSSELIEEYPPIGGDYGGNYINEAFIKTFITEIFGEENVNKLQNDIKNEDWDDFERKIEELKKSFSENESCNLKLDCHIFEDGIDMKLDDYISKYNSKYHKYQISKIKRWELSFPSRYMI